MEEEYNMEAQDANMSDVSNSGVDGDIGDQKEFGDVYDEGFEDEDGSNNFRNNRGRGNFRNRGGRPPPGWMNGPPMRFRGRGYGPAGPPMRGRGFFRGRGAPRGFGPNNGPNFDNNWGPMGPPPPGMMGGPPPFGPPPGMMPPGGPMGPPPNMMSQPPPFGGPPGMPPPNMPQPELWVETKSDEGKPYYYHVRTRETTWTRPQDSPACKVITQAEVEAMAAAGQIPGIGPQNMGMGGAAMGGAPMGVMGGGAGQPPYATPPPWLKDQGQGKEGRSEEGAGESDEMPPGEAAPPGHGPPPGGPVCYPGGWGAGGWGGWPPPLVAQPPPALNTANVPDSGAATQQIVPTSSSNQQPVIQETIQLADTPPPHQPQPKEETVIPASLAVAAGAWSTHRAPDGRPYYYHAATNHSVWEKPQPLKDIEELQAKIAAEKGEKIDRKSKTDIDESKIEVIDVEAHAEAVAAAAAAERAERERIERERAEKEKAEKEKEKQEKDAQDKKKAKQDKTKPISITPMPGTPWCVVWTGDGRVFYYDATARASVWERPAALADRADVDRAVANPPAALTQLQREESAAPASTASTATTNAAPAKSANGETKRAADSDSDDSDTEPPKKQKQDEKSNSSDNSKSSTGQILVGAAAAVEAEVRAARERGVVPHEQRLKSFLAMLHEKQVSAFSTWEKELHKIVFDPRYLMLNCKERRQVFDQYVRDRAEGERKEKKNRLQQKKNAFRALMEEAKLHSKSSFSDFSTKHGRDERFKGIEKSRDRETYFNEYIAEVRKREKEEKEKKREQAKAEFFALLKEKGVDRHARYGEVKKKIEGDARYKAVEGGATREDYFREYCKQLKDDRRKDKDTKDRDRSSKKDKKEKDRDKEKEKEGKREKKKEKEPKETEVTEEVSEEPEEAESAAREREARAQASIKEREREVQRALATSLRDRDKERQHHKRDEAVQHFNALLADLVRNPELTWREAKKQLKKDHRYALAELLSKEDKERLFSSHTNTLSCKRRDKLRGVLTALKIPHNAAWRDVKEQLQADPNTPHYSSVAQMEREFREYQRDKQSAAKGALRQLLAETRGITHRTLEHVRDNTLQHVHDMLTHDNRFLALEHIPEERDLIIMGYLEELEKKGPPPPPTATEPTRRPKP